MKFLKPSKWKIAFSVLIILIVVYFLRNSFCTELDITSKGFDYSSVSPFVCGHTELKELFVGYVVLLIIFAFLYVILSTRDLIPKK